MNRDMQYAKRWRHFWGGAIALSLALSAVVVEPAALAGAAAAGAAGAAIFTLVLTSEEEESRAALAARLRHAVAWGASSLAALTVVGTLSGSLLLWLLLAASLSSPAVRAAGRSVRARMTMPETEEELQLFVEETTRDILGRLSSVELCQTWRSTHRRLQLTPSAAELAAYAGLREMVLEELELRHPRELARWLADGGDPAEAPSQLAM